MFNNYNYTLTAVFCPFATQRPNWLFRIARYSVSLTGEYVNKFIVLRK